MLKYDHLTPERIEWLLAKCFRRYYFRWQYLRENAALLWPVLRRLGSARTRQSEPQAGRGRFRHGEAGGRAAYPPVGWTSELASADLVTTLRVVTHWMAAPRPRAHAQQPAHARRGRGAAVQCVPTRSVGTRHPTGDFCSKKAKKAHLICQRPFLDLGLSSGSIGPRRGRPANLDKSRTCRHFSPLAPGRPPSTYPLIGRIAVANDLRDPSDGVESADIALDEFRATQDEFTDILRRRVRSAPGTVAGTLRAAQVPGNQQRTEIGVGGNARRLPRRVAPLDAKDFSSCTANCRPISRRRNRVAPRKIRAGYQRFLDDHADLREIRESFRQIADEFAGIKEDVQRRAHGSARAVCERRKSNIAAVDLDGGIGGCPVTIGRQRADR